MQMKLAALLVAALCESGRALHAVPDQTGLKLHHVRVCTKLTPKLFTPHSITPCHALVPHSAPRRIVKVSQQDHVEFVLQASFFDRSILLQKLVNASYCWVFQVRTGVSGILTLTILLRLQPAAGTDAIALVQVAAVFVRLLLALPPPLCSRTAAASGSSPALAPAPAALATQLSQPEFQERQIRGKSNQADRGSPARQIYDRMTSQM